MKEILVNNSKELVYEKNNVQVFRIGKDVYEVYVEGVKVDGRIHFPVKLGTGCDNCLYFKGMCIFKDIAGVYCSDISFFGFDDIMSWVKE